MYQRIANSNNNFGVTGNIALHDGLWVHSLNLRHILEISNLSLFRDRTFSDLFFILV